MIHAKSVDCFGADTSAQTVTLKLVIDNLGNGPAVDLTLEDGTSFICVPSRVSVAARGKQTLTLSGTTNQMQFEVPLTYENLRGARWTTTIGVDLTRGEDPESRVVRHETRRTG